MTEPVHEVFALKYAQRDGRRPLHFVGGDPHDVPMPMDYFIRVVRNAERTVLVDTGFDAAMAGAQALSRHIARAGRYRRQPGRGSRRVAQRTGTRRAA